MPANSHQGVRPGVRRMKGKRQKFRLTELIVSVIAVFVAMIWTERSAWNQIARLRSSMTVQQLETFRSANRIRTAVLDVRAELKRPGTLEEHIPEIRRAADIVHAALRDQKNSAETAGEREVGQRIEALFEDYVGRATTRPDAAKATHEADIQRQLERVLELTDQLSALNHSAAERFVLDANAALTRLQRFIFVSAAAVLAAGAVIIVLAYRGTFAPMRQTLNESQAIIERQEKLASLGVFAAGIAHEIRNPLTAIKVRLFSLKATHRPGTSEREDTEVIESEIDRLERIVREFLQFARPSEPVLQTVRSGKLLQQTSDLLSSALAKKSLRLDLDVLADEPLRVDADKIKQVLINLIQNAADSMEAGGAVTLRSRANTQPLNGRLARVVVIDVADTGKGMSSEVQKRLFDPFFTTKEKGTGLGLPISARIIEKHGGVVEYQSQPGRGTTFSVVLPVAQTNEE